MRHLVIAVEHRDHETGAHLVRIGYQCALLAPALGWNSGLARLLMLAGPLHDIGKIGIPDRVLKKNGSLSRSEHQIMERHPEYGAHILSGSEAPVMRLASEIALNHHERFDGGGYPGGLKGGEIPLSARMVAVVDMFDALAMDRSYRPAMPVEHALELIRWERRRHLDPDVVDAFFSVIDRILALREVINRGERPGAIPAIIGLPEDDLLSFYDSPLAWTPEMSAADPAPNQ